MRHVISHCWGLEIKCRTKFSFSPSDMLPLLQNKQCCREAGDGEPSSFGLQYEILPSNHLCIIECVFPLSV